MADNDLNRAIINAAGELRSSQTLPDLIPITESGPVINGAILEGLPGPCVPVPQPTDNALLNRETTCSTATSATSYELVTNSTADYLSPIGSGRRYTVWAKTVKVVRNAPLRVFFDFTNAQVNGGGISIIQSRRPLIEGTVDTARIGDDLAAWLQESSTFRIRDTRSDGSEASNNGSQIGQYGKDLWQSGQDLLSRPVQQLFDVEAETVTRQPFFVGTQDTTLLSGQALLPLYSDRSELRVSGFGFVQGTVNCALGEYVTVFVITDSTVEQPNSNSQLLWQAVIEYQKRRVAATEAFGECDEQNLNAPSRAYQQGGITNEWVGTTQFGYFGQTQRQGETVGAPSAPLSQTATQPSNRFVDNIYFPYEAPPVDYITEIINQLNANNPGANLAQGYFREPSRFAGAMGIAPNIKQAPRIIRSLEGVYNMPSGSRTVEIKGYFRAPVTGNYEFFGAATDGLWMWISSRGVSGTQRSGVDEFGRMWDGVTESQRSEGEYFVTDGFSGGTGTNYGRNNYVLRVGPQTAGTTVQLQSNGIRVNLREDHYYFVRILSGAALRSAAFQLEYQVSAGGGNIIRSGITFGGRSCPGDNPPPATDIVGGSIVDPGTGGGGGTFVGPGPGGGFGSGGGIGGYIFPWWEQQR